jgi:splicing factor 3B subunit 3
MKEGGRVLEFMHKVSPRACSMNIADDQTKTDDVPLCLAGFQGYMLAGIGKSLRLYEMGKKALLRKCENSVCLLRDT